MGHIQIQDRPVIFIQDLSGIHIVIVITIVNLILISDYDYT